MYLTEFKIKYINIAYIYLSINEKLKICFNKFSLFTNSLKLNNKLDTLMI